MAARTVSFADGEVTSGDQPEWVFSFSDIEVSDTVLGRGAFGEVRVAKWRNIDVACKRLHSSESSDQVEDLDNDTLSALKQEVHMLSTLRHPNLVLFLGICGDLNGKNTAILTELMPCSLYDIVEVKKVRLNLADVLDIANDVANGLDYLHRNTPSIVHRDISSKNILIGGNCAKIADLGQAKLFGHNTLSRQTGMPGAMAYSAPEVLTGKYSAKIDIFSFGILLAQMCSGEYPRIDRREDQISKACEQQPLLDGLIRSTVSYQPHERPVAHAVCEMLTGFISNDRHYPNARRHHPEKGIGIIERSWVQEQIHSQCHEVKVDLERTKSLLRAEEARWRAEAAKVDGINNARKEAEDNLQEALGVLASVKDELQQTKLALDGKSNSNDDLRHQLQVVGADVQRLTSRVQQYEVQVAQLMLEQQQSSGAIQRLTSEAEENAHQLEMSRTSEQNLTSQCEQLRLQLNMQLEYVRDLETRLEQALTRWKLDKDKLREEGTRFSKVNAQCAAAIEKSARLQRELDRYEARLKQYDDLPMPEEIRQRIGDLQQDAERRKKEAMDLLAEREELQAEREGLRDILQSKLCQVEELQAEVEQKQSKIDDQQAELRSLQNYVERVKEEKAHNDAEMQQMVTQQEEMRDAEEKLKEELQGIKTELARERRMTEILRSNNPQMLADAMNSSLLSTGNNANSNNNDGDDALDYGLDLPTSDHPEGEQQGSSLDIIDTNAEARITSFSALASVANRSASVDQQPGISEEETESDSAVKHAIYWAKEQSGTAGVLELMQQKLEDERYVWRGCRALREQILKNEEDKVLCYDSHMQDWLLNCLRTPQIATSAVAQGHSMRLIGALAFGNDWFRRKAGEKGVMQCVIDAMVNHAQDETVLLHSTTALTNLAHNSMENRSRFVELEGVDVLIAALIRLKDSAKLVRQGCWAVLTLAATDSIAQLIAERGGDSAILNGMLIHRFDAGVQRFGCWALSNLALSSADVARRVKKKGALEVCRMALEAHSQDPEVVRQARHMLGVFSPLPVGTSSSGSGGGGAPSPTGGSSGGATRSSRPYSGGGTSGAAGGGGGVGGEGGGVHRVLQRNVSAALGGGEEGSVDRSAGGGANRDPRSRKASAARGTARGSSSGGGTSLLASSTSHGAL